MTDPGGQEREVTFEVIRGPEGVCLAVGDESELMLTRIAGPKPWGGGKTIHKFNVNLAELLKLVAQ
jgi:hypothetical protein